MRSPLSTPFFKSPRISARVCQAKAGPSKSRLANVVTSLIVEAGLRCSSPLSSANTRPDSGSTIAKPAAPSGRWCAGGGRRGGGSRDDGRRGRERESIRASRQYQRKGAGDVYKTSADPSSTHSQ